MPAATSPARRATRPITPRRPADPARIRTRFPPEPNGYLHIGHAKSICLNFGLASDYGGICHLRFDDTNPEKEEQEYVDAIVDAVHWLGFDWTAPEPALGGAPTSHLYFASDYFDFMYRAAEALVVAGHAYVDEQSAEEMRASRGDFATPGRASVYRVTHAGREPDPPAPDEERRARRRRRRAAREDRPGEPEHQPARPGAVPDQARDPSQHRRRLVHLSDVHLRASDRRRARERHALDLHARVRGPAAVLRLAARHARQSRPAEAATAAPVRVRAPQRHLRHHQQAKAQAAGRRGHRRRLGRPAHADDRGPAQARLHAGVDPRHVRACRHQQGRRLDRLREPRDRAARRPRGEGAARDGGARPDPPRADQLGRDLRQRHAPRAVPRAGASAAARARHARVQASGPSSGSSATTSPKCRPRGSSASIPATGFASSTATSSSAPAARRMRTASSPASLRRSSPTRAAARPGADAVKVKGTLTWLAVDDALPAEVRLYDRLFNEPHPDAGGKDFKAEPACRRARRSSPGSSSARWRRQSVATRFQFERHGYFVADLVDHDPARPVFNRTATLRDTWSR